MPSPVPSSQPATLRPDLAALMEFDLAMDRMGFIGHIVLPVLDVGLQASSFAKVKIESLLQDRNTARNSGGGYNRSNWKFDQESYATTEHGLEEPVDDRLKAIYALLLDAELVATQRAIDGTLRAGEKRTADLVFNTTTFTGDLAQAATAAWDDEDNATPINDVETAVRAIYERTGIWPDTLILHRLAFRNLRLSAQVRERIAATGAGYPTRAQDVTPAMIAAVFDLSKVRIAGSTRNSANEGQTATLSPIWSDSYAMVAKTADTNDIQEPCLGRTFHWAGDGSSIEGVVEMYRDESIRGEIVRVRHETHEKLLYPEMGQLITGIKT